MSNKINPLICLPSPRDIPVVKEALDEIKDYDKLWMKYFYDELKAYELMRNYFLEHKEYTHLAIMPDDLFLDPESFYKLIEDLKKRDYPVLSGIANFNCDKFETYDIDLAIDYNHSNGREHLMANEIPNREYYAKAGTNKGIKKVAFAGFPLTFIRRDVVEKIPFRSLGRGIDTSFCVDCLRNRVDQYVDFDARSLHLKGIENCEDIGVLLGFQFEGNISTIVNPKKKVIPKILLQKGIEQPVEIDIQK